MRLGGWEAKGLNSQLIFKLATDTHEHFSEQPAQTNTVIRQRRIKQINFSSLKLIICRLAVIANNIKYNALRPLKNVPFCPIYVSDSNFNPLNILSIPVAKIFCFLELKQK
jgi:hypothetical protein